MSYGRKSTASLSIVAPLPEGERPPAPPTLTADEAKEWVEIAGAMPANWFTRETHAVLENACRHIVQARTLAVKIAAAQERCRTAEEVRQLDKLLHMRQRETKALADLLRALRCTQQARIEKQTAGRQHARHRGSFYDVMEIGDNDKG